ncbi:MAG TPA: nucleoside deaminase [Polyangiales bacterium]|nr:nucleoside deaminase [Polyangiales bacterium]
MSQVLSISIPAWLDETVAAFSGTLGDDESRMRLAIRLSRENVERGGGPFGAALFAGDTLLAAGVNRVLASGLSIAHAEIVTLMRAQTAAQAQPIAEWTLYSSTEPCCQCFGAVVWSGVTRLVCGAVTSDAEAVGFDEGPKPEAWPDALEKRGIQVRLGVCRDEAREVLDEYKRRGGTIYGLRSGRS